ncbi:MAG: LysR family transcriptional regulator [Alphaproteobacteria bacterium]|uniref:LysR family transcriptional regulator n=1 Tax=Pyruvatibacter sp. HU-CL02332 TaxID=3127650 RepID=UPI00296A46A5|nr:LysR family transcriptional regulator [Alphaproteobacteria bacterium]
MNLEDILTFAEVLDSGSFTAAAHVLGMPKSNVSRSISRLEKALGVRLIERTTRSLQPTEIGRAYYAHAVRVKDELEAANASIEQFTISPRGRLRVCTSVTVGQNLLSPHLGTFAKTYPDVKIDLQLTNRRVDLLEEGFDVVIRVGEMADSNLIAARLCTKQMGLYASSDYLKTAHPLTKPDDLEGHSCLHMNAVDKRARWSLQSPSGDIEFAFKPQIACDDFNVLRQLALDGAGVALLPDYLAEGFVRRGELKRVLSDWTGGQVDFFTVVPSRRGITPKVRAFLDHLHANC